MKHRVYIHRKNDTGEIYYVGRGRGNRPRQFTRGRSRAWQQIYQQSGCLVEIIAEYDDESLAAVHEQIYIAACREEGIPIVNYKNGGFDRNVGIPKTPETKAKVRLARLKTNGNRCAVKTPLGTFVSMAQAAAAHNMSLDQIYYRVRHKPGFDLV